MISPTQLPLPDPASPLGRALLTILAEQQLLVVLVTNEAQDDLLDIRVVRVETIGTLAHLIQKSRITKGNA